MTAWIVFAKTAPRKARQLNLIVMPHPNIMADYFLNLELVHPSCIAKVLTGGLLPKNGMVWEIGNELLPVDIYCYLHAKYGTPNGLQNFLRSDDSDNL
ncbi:MAG: hypothetical protein KGJ50_06655, partial [Xanthomonadaceae bacterium]|nr:hypothetical protein [Xanthomonadaceae bacterium]